MAESDNKSPAEQSRIESRRVIAQQYLNQLLPAEYPTGRAVSLWQNWWETIGKIIDFYGDEEKGLVGKDVVRDGVEFKKAEDAKKILTSQIQSKLDESNKLNDQQLNEWLGRVTPIQFNAIVEAISESDLSLYSKSPQERFDDALDRVAQDK